MFSFYHGHIYSLNVVQETTTTKEHDVEKNF